MENWRDNLSDELKTDSNLAKYNSLEDALKGGIAAQSRIGRSVVIPNDDSDVEEMTAYYDKLQSTSNGKLIVHPDAADGEQSKAFWEMLGRPDDVKGYTTPDDVSIQPEVVENLRKMALESGLTTKQFNKQIELLNAEAQSQASDAEEFRNNDSSIVKAKFGLAEDSKKQAISVLIDKFADPDHPLGELNAAAYLMMDNIVNAFSGKGPQVFQQPDSSNHKTPDEIDSELGVIMGRLAKGGGKLSRDEYRRLQRKQVALLKERQASSN